MDKSHDCDRICTNAMNVSATDVEMRGQISQDSRDAGCIYGSQCSWCRFNGAAACNCSLGYALGIALLFPKVLKDLWDSLHMPDAPL